MRKFFILLFMMCLTIPCFGGVEFDGSASAGDDYLNCGSDSSLDSMCNGGCSISVWVYPDSTGEGGFGKVISKATSASVGWEFQAVNTTKVAFAHTWTTSGANRNSADGVLSLSAWQNYVVTYDGSADHTNIHIYKDCTEVDYTGGFSSDGSGAINPQTAEDVLIGNRVNNNRTFDGKVDQLYLFKHTGGSVLSSQSIQQLCKSRERGIAYQIPDFQEGWELDECGNGATCTGTGQFKAMVKPSTNNCTANNSPVGRAGQISSYP